MGGIENFLALLCKNISSRWSNFALVHHHQSFKNTIEESLDNSQITRVSCLGRLFFAPISPTFPFHLQKKIKTIAPDIIHIHLPNTSAFFLLLNKKAKQIPWIIHWHSDVISSPTQTSLRWLYPLYRPFERALLKRAKKIICTSPIYLEHSKTLQAFKEKCDVVPLGIELKTQDNSIHVKPKLHWKKDKKKILSIGRLTYYKGFKHLIQAMSLLDSDCQLIIVGKGELKKKLQLQIDQLNLTSRVIIAENIDNPTLQHLQQSCDVFCLPSIEKTEAFGLVLLEMMQYQKPIVVSYVEGSGMNWVIEDQYNGLFSKAKNANDLAKKISLLLTNPELAERLAVNGYQKLQQSFQMSTIAKDVEAIYEQILENKQ